MNASGFRLVPGVVDVAQVDREQGRLAMAWLDREVRRSSGDTQDASGDIFPEIITPWKLEEYTTQLDTNINALAAAVLISQAQFALGAFDIKGWNQFLQNWQDFKAHNDWTDNWISTGTTWNRTEAYHKRYRAFYGAAKQNGIVEAPDPMAPPYEVDPPSGPGSRTRGGDAPKIEGYLQAGLVVGGLFAVGYVLRGVR